MTSHSSYISIKNWAEDDRPREKLLAKGRSALSDAELIAILIGSGSKNESAVELSQKILAGAGNNLNALGKVSVKDLMKFKGIGEAKAISIAAALELGRRRKKEKPGKRDKILTSRDVFEFFYPQLADLPHEEFWILLLNRANNIIHKVNISRGGISGTIVDVRIILKIAIENLATSIVLCHNHPSGNIMPSQSDTELTKNLKQAAALVEIQVLDHIIIGENAYYSFSDEGVI